MADISKINPNGTEYNLKDATARADIESSKTIKSSVVTVTDAAPINAEDITVDITPIQDLHGYDRPWAGGAWKNNLPMTVEGIKALNTVGTWSDNVYIYNGITYTILTDNDNNIIGIKLTGTATSSNSRLSIDSSIVSADIIGNILNGCPSGASLESYYMRIQEVGGSYNTLATDIGNGAIIGNTSRENSQCFITVLANVTIPNGGILFQPMIRLSTETDATFAPYSNICPIEGWTGAELTQKDDATNPTVTHTYTASFGEAVHGGKWHVTAGGTTVDRGNITLNGGENYTVNSSGTDKVSFRYKNADIKANPEFSQISNILNYHRNAWSHNVPAFSFVVGIGELFINVPKTTASTTEELKAWIASNNLQFVYELATPTTISTPKQNVPMLQGINTVYADCGDVSLKYQPDNVIGELKGEIEDNIIYEDFKWTTESSQSYSAGTPGTYGTSCWRDVKKEGYDVIGVTFVENRRFGDCILTLYYIPSTSHVEVIIFRATSSAVTIADDDITYRVAYKKH